MTITDEQLLELPFDELAALCANADERTQVAVRLGELATPSFPAPVDSLARALLTEIRLREIRWEWYCAKLREQEYALQHLRALGVAIATVARARLVSRVLDDRAPERIELGQVFLTRIGPMTMGRVATLHVVRMPTYGPYEPVAVFVGKLDDIAAEAVGRLLAEVGL